MSGLMHANRTPQGDPFRVVFPLTDITTGFYTSHGILTALYERERTGKGQHIDLAMLGVAMMLQASLMTGYFRNATEPKPHGNK